jgi:hypothetical protein
MKFLLITICIFWHANLYSQTESNQDFEKLISNNLKALNIAKSKKDITSINKILSEIAINQKLFDTLILSQILEYEKYTNAYKTNLDSSDFKIVYSSNKLNSELNTILNRNKNSTSTKQTNIVGLKYCDLNSEFKLGTNFNDQNSMNIEIDNLTCYLLICSISIIDAKSNTITSKNIFKVEPNTKGYDFFLGDNINAKDVYVVQAYKYFNTDMKEYYIYKKSNLLKIKGPLNILSSITFDKNNLENSIITSEINNIFKN